MDRYKQGLRRSDFDLYFVTELKVNADSPFRVAALLLAWLSLFSLYAFGHKNGCVD